MDEYGVVKEHDSSDFDHLYELPAADALDPGYTTNVDYGALQYPKMALCFQMLNKGVWGPDDYMINGPFDKLYKESSKSVSQSEDSAEVACPRSVQITSREALKPIRVFSFNHRVPIINLSDGVHFRLFFVSGHLAVIYDIKKNEQQILRGHVNAITCSSASANRRWLATGDAGADSAVIVWDARSYRAVRCLYAAHPGGVVALRLTPDARYLATLSAPLGQHQALALWDWTCRSGGDSDDKGREGTAEEDEEERPQALCFTQLDVQEVGLQTQIAFKPNDYFQVMSNSDRRVVFYDWTIEGCMTSHAPVLTPETFRKNYGQLVMSVYVPDTDTAITATSKGFLVVWEKNCWLRKSQKESPCFKMASRLIPIHQAGITYLTITSCVSSKMAIVTGDEEGRIRFCDSKFKLLHWHHDIKQGAISSISFAETGMFDKRDVYEKFGLEEFSPRKDSVDTLDPKVNFLTEDFFVSTSQAIILSLEVENKTIRLIERDQASTVNGIATHPLRDFVTTVGHSGMVKTWNYKWLVPIRTRMLENLKLNACAFDPFGIFLAIGCTSGRVLFLDALTLNDVNQPPFDYAKGCVTKLVFSSDSAYCAYIDSQNSTTLLSRTNTRDLKARAWSFSGRYRAHGDRIVDIVFKTFSNDKTPRLFTIGDDRMLIEYDVLRAQHDVLPLKRRIQVENVAKPQCFTPMGDFYAENFICIANSDSKFRLFDVDSFAIRKTIAAPIRGSPFVSLATLPERDNFPTPPSSPSDLEKPIDKNALVFLTNEQLGIVLVPLDGNPYKASHIIAHPSGEHGSAYASSLAVPRDFRFIFTTGGVDNSMVMWRTDPGVLVAQTQLYCDPMEPFYNMLTEEEMHDMKDYFYLAMLRVQGFSNTDTRRTTYTIPISELPNLARAMGLFLTEADIENMINDVKYSKYGATGRCVSELDFDTFVKLYLNYREPYGSLSLEEIDSLFDAIQKAEKPHEVLCPNRNLCVENEQPNLQRDSLLRLIQTVGEPMRHDELVEALSVILGLAPLAGQLEDSCAMKELRVTKEIEEKLPVCINPTEFYKSFLDMSVCEKQPREIPNVRTQFKVRIAPSGGFCKAD